jgi:hypothetical protein
MGKVFTISLVVLVLISIGFSIYNSVELTNLRADYLELKSSYKSNVMQTLNSCEVTETQNSEYGNSNSISCDDVCMDIEKICIKQDYGSYGESGWIFDTGSDCSVSYGGINNIDELGGSKLHCTCC